MHERRQRRQSTARPDRAHARGADQEPCATGQKDGREPRGIRPKDRRERRESRRFRDDLRRWAALGVKEARKQRKNHREIEMYLMRLAAAQLVTEERLDGLIASLRSGRNGGGRKSV